MALSGFRDSRLDPPLATSPLLEVAMRPRVCSLLPSAPWGRQVRAYAAYYEAGPHRIEWDLRTSQGNRVAPGVYTCRLGAGGRELRRRAVVLP